MECVRGCDVVACRGGTALEPHFLFNLNRLCRLQFCNNQYSVISLPRMEFVLGWGVPLLCKVFGGLLPSPSPAIHVNEFLQLYMYWIFRV